MFSSGGIVRQSLSIAIITTTRVHLMVDPVRSERKSVPRCLPRLVSKMAVENARYFNRQFVHLPLLLAIERGFRSNQSGSTFFEGDLYDWRILNFRMIYDDLIGEEKIRCVYNFF